jgi:hypothetical protein
VWTKGNQRSCHIVKIVKGAESLCNGGVWKAVDHGVLDHGAGSELDQETGVEEWL